MATIVALALCAVDKQYSGPIYNARRDKLRVISSTITVLLNSLFMTLAIYSLSYGRPFSHKATIIVLAVQFVDSSILGSYFTIKNLQHVFFNNPEDEDDNRRSLLDPDLRD